MAVCLCLLSSRESVAQRVLSGLRYNAEWVASGASHKTPLWLHANRYGLSSLDSWNGYVRTSIERETAADSARAWGVSYGVDVVLPLHFTSKIVVQQAYGAVRWRQGELTVGSREYAPLMNDAHLSSGALGEGCNARPVPQVRLALPTYWSVPRTKGWLAVKGHVAFGRYTDGAWQERWTGGRQKYSTGTLYHSKSGLLRVGHAGKRGRWSVEMGLEMVAQFGGTHYVRGRGAKERIIKGDSGWRGYWHAFMPGGAGENEGGSAYQNAEGNQLGTWLLRGQWENKNVGVSLYAEKYFEDHSAMFLLDYDGYGGGEEWMDKKERRYYRYAPKDGLWGLSLRWKRAKWLDKIVVEYTYQKYQSGPIYHDHTANIPDHLGGVDDYYNHAIFPGFQHWGQVCGNPLFLSPLYNEGGDLSVRNNRFKAWHVGLQGAWAKRWTWRALLTWQDGLGTYKKPLRERQEGYYGLLETTYKGKNGWAVNVGLGGDAGALRGTQWGCRVGVSKRGWLVK